MTTALHTFGAERAYTQSRDLASYSHWLLRIGFAAVFLFHGVGKLVDPGAFAAMMGLPDLVAVLVALAEVGGGLAVLVGGLVRRDWLTRLGGGVTIPVLIGAIAMVHWGQWSFVPSETALDRAGRSARHAESVRRSGSARRARCAAVSSSGSTGNQAS